MKFNGVELKPGCLIRLKNKRGDCWNRNGKMDRYINRIVTISHIYQEGSNYYFEIIQDPDDNDNTWLFWIDDIQCVVSTPLPEDQTTTYNPDDFSPVTCQFYKPESTALLKLGDVEMEIMDKTFTKKQIKNWKKYFGVEVINLKEDK